MNGSDDDDDDERVFLQNSIKRKQQFLSFTIIKIYGYEEAACKKKKKTVHMWKRAPIVHSRPNLTAASWFHPDIVVSIRKMSLTGTFVSFRFVLPLMFPSQVHGNKVHWRDRITFWMCTV